VKSAFSTILQGRLPPTIHEHVNEITQGDWNLEKEIWKDEDVKAAGYNVSHPLIGVPTMVVETNGKKTAREAVDDAVKRMKKQNADFMKALKK